MAPPLYSSIVYPGPVNCFEVKGCVQHPSGPLSPFPDVLRPGMVALIVGAMKSGQHLPQGQLRLIGGARVRGVSGGREVMRKIAPDEHDGHCALTSPRMIPLLSPSVRNDVTVDLSLRPQESYAGMY